MPNSVVAHIYIDGQPAGIIPLSTKDFNTGSKGYYASAKVVDPGNPAARYQSQVQMVLIGSKPKK